MYSYVYAINSDAYSFLVHKFENPDVHDNTQLLSLEIYFYDDVFLCDPICPKKNLWYDWKSRRNGYRAKKQQKKWESFGQEYLTCMLETGPNNFGKVISKLEARYWKEVIISEIEYIMQNLTWELVNHPPWIKPLGSK